MVEVKTKEELQKALTKNEKIIHVDNVKLSIGLITRPGKHRLIMHTVRKNGYMLIKARMLGTFDVMMVKDRKHLREAFFSQTGKIC